MTDQEVGKDVVVLHMFARGIATPNPSPYPIKFETYLRVAGIKYITDFTKPQSSKGKSPWMTFNGEDMADSQFCMDHLAKTLNKDLSSHLSPQERAVARGMRAILEDNFYFCKAMEKWAFGDPQDVLESFGGGLPGVPGFLSGVAVKFVARGMKQQCYSQGIGRHTKEEIRSIGLNDLRSLSDYLGTKQYLMGDGDKPTEMDCVLFAFTSLNVYGQKEDNVYRKAIEEDFPNLKKHCLMMKEKYWPDWDQCLAKTSGT